MFAGKLLHGVVIGVVAALVVSFSPGAALADKTKHVLIIGIDGAMPDAVKAAKAPNLKALAADGAVSWDAFAGGVLGTPSRQNTASLASWNSILTGVWANKHKGARMLRGQPVPADYVSYPNIFQRLKSHEPTARSVCISNWPIITQVMAPGATFKARGEGDAKVVELAKKELAENTPTLMFLQLDEVDGAGHGNNYGPKIPKYIEAIEQVDKHVGELVAAVKARKTYANEEWLIIAVTDHGGTKDPKGPGGVHGGDSPQERKALIIVSGAAAKKGEVSPGPGITAAAPTALAFLGIKIAPQWNLDAQPFGLK
ncbi:MAG: alkaline phosphatase family protein [Planctomycetaceae bacterium]|nr:alkaline phosphatase family protein [Planctomycetaceae bacterium]